jgi:c-di-GMP-binding flagellar brake protein YcgR
MYRIFDRFTQTIPNLEHMTTFENLNGDKLFLIFQQLVNQKILIKVYLPQVEYESLTLVTDTCDEDRRPIFRIDVPKGLLAAITESKSKQLSFEFTSTDKVSHRFKSDIATIENKSISLLYPQLIQRHQQRDNFRIKAPYDSNATILVEDKLIRMEIDNISLGGAYCYCPNKYKSTMVQGLELTGMELIFNLKSQSSHIMIQNTAIKRVESRHRPRHFGIAFEFIKIKKDYKKQLVQLIYDLQRAYLQNRLKNI